MSHPPEKRLELRSAYISGLPLDTASRKVGIPYSTARSWQKAARNSGDDWDKFRAASFIMSGGGIEQAMGRIIGAGLMRCEALLELLDDPELSVDIATSMQAMATLGDTISKLRAASKGMMPEADQLSIENNTIKGLTDLFVRLHPKHADLMLATVEAWAGGQR